MNTKAIGSQNWPNVNGALKAFYKEDKTLIKIIKIIPNIIKLIGAFFVDVSNKFLAVFWTGSKASLIENTQESGFALRTKNFWKNHKRKILLSVVVFTALGAIFTLRYHFSSNKSIKQDNLLKDFKEAEINSKNEVDEFIAQERARIDEDTCYFDRASKRSFYQADHSTSASYFDKNLGKKIKIDYSCKAISGNREGETPIYKIICEKVTNIFNSKFNLEKSDSEFTHFLISEDCGKTWIDKLADNTKSLPTS